MLTLILTSNTVTNTSGAWTLETIASEGDVGYYTSLAIDSFDKVH